MGAAEYPSLHRTSPTTENYLVQSASGAEFEKSCFSIGALNLDHCHPRAPPRTMPVCTLRPAHFRRVHRLASVRLQPAQLLVVEGGGTAIGLIQELFLKKKKN